MRDYTGLARYNKDKKITPSTGATRNINKEYMRGDKEYMRHKSDNRGAIKVTVLDRTDVKRGYMWIEGTNGI